MGSTSESCSRSLLDAEVNEFMKRARKIARKWHFKVGLDDEDLAQDLLVKYVEAKDCVPDGYNREAYLTAVMSRGVKNHLDKWYRKGDTAQRSAADIDDVDIEDYKSDRDIMAVNAMYREIGNQQPRRQEILIDHIKNDADHGDVGISKRIFNRHISEFIEHMQEKLGLEKVKRLERRHEVYIIEKDGMKESGTVGELYKRLNLDAGNLTKVVRGKQKSVSGWRLSH